MNPDPNEEGPACNEAPGTNHYNQDHSTTGLSDLQAWDEDEDDGPAEPTPAGILAQAIGQAAHGIIAAELAACPGVVEVGFDCDLDPEYYHAPTISVTCLASVDWPGLVRPILQVWQRYFGLRKDPVDWASTTPDPDRQLWLHISTFVVRLEVRIWLTHDQARSCSPNEACVSINKALRGKRPKRGVR